jgi:hypothetical protein
MGKKDGRQKGAQKHAEGQHGRKAHARLIETVQEGRPPSPRELRARSRQGEHRLQQDRQQHDDAEKHSEKNRLNR